MAFLFDASKKRETIRIQTGQARTPKLGTIDIKKAPTSRLALFLNLAPPTGLNGGAQLSDIFRQAEQLKI
ncbi:hypothetical protein BZJ20_12790 [Salinivibrio proteolyticus]|nr:hypothetical protein BZJ20_12790 [Salinivibrio proteolyticus]